MAIKDGFKQNLQSSDPETRLAHIRELISVSVSEEFYWELLEDPHEKIRNFAVMQLANLIRVNADEVHKKLCHHHWFVKCAVLDILGKRKDSRFLDILLPLFYDRNVEVRKTIARVLGEMGGRKALKLLMLLLRDENRFVRSEAEKAVEKASRLKFI
jgi:HEAT repeat protein